MIHYCHFPQQRHYRLLSDIHLIENCFAHRRRVFIMTYLYVNIRDILRFIDHWLFTYDLTSPEPLDKLLDLKDTEVLIEERSGFSTTQAQLTICGMLSSTNRHFIFRRLHACGCILIFVIYLFLFFVSFEFVGLISVRTNPCRFRGIVPIISGMQVSICKLSKHLREKSLFPQNT